MRLIILLGAFGVLLVSQASCRAIDNDLDNTIQSIDGSSDFVARDWIKLVKPLPAKVLQTPGEPIELVCEIMGSPPPTIEWIRGRPQMNMINDMQSNLISESSSSSIVRVRSVLVLDHVPNETTYTCIGRAGGKTIFSSSTVYSTPGQSNGNIRKPKIVYGYTVLFDILGSNVLIPCKAIGRSRPEIYWTDNSNTVITGQDPRIKVLPTGELLISGLKWSDMGQYTCIARNSVGKDALQTFVYPVINDEEI